MLLAILAGKAELLLEAEARVRRGTLDWVESDYAFAPHIRGLSEAAVPDGFDRHMRPLKNVPETVRDIKRRGIACILITAGPRQVAAVAAERWGFDAYYASDYEAERGAFTGRILDNLADTGKVPCLLRHCEALGISPGDCLAVGDGASDIPLFKTCGHSVAINASPENARQASHSLDTDDLADILRFIPR